MPSVFLNQTEMGGLLAAQYALNNTYDPSGGWKDKGFGVNFDAALYAEWAEFLGEVERVWKWYYKHTKEVVVDEAVFELVDVVHFGLARILNRAQGLSLEEVQTISNMYFSTLPPRVAFEDMGASAALERCQEALNALMRPTATTAEQLLALDALIMFGCTLFGISKATFLDAYSQKNSRNHNRVKLGVMEGVDVKAEEHPLQLNRL